MLLRLAVGLALIVVPMLELMLLIKIGQHIGVLATTALVLGAALAGALIISRQSLAVITRTLEAAAEGRPPVEPVLDGLFLIVAGVLLLIPGVLTDLVAVVLLIAPVRRWVARVCMRGLLRWADVRVEGLRREAGMGRDPGSDWRRPAPGAGDGPVIEGEFERVDERPVHRPGTDGNNKAIRP